MKTCTNCGITKDEICFGGRGKNRPNDLLSICKDCKKIINKEARRNFKIECIKYLGGKCYNCGLIGCPAIYDFHHKTPEEKDFSLGGVSTTKISDKILSELDKCVLLCANCHRELHYNE